jgi:hypothetical protein
LVSIKELYYDARPTKSQNIVCSIAPHYYGASKKALKKEYDCITGKNNE